MKEPVSARLRHLVFNRANGICEYCLAHQFDAAFTFQVDHVVSRKQRGRTTAANLALACLRCNLAKGTDAGAYIGRPPRLVRLFHPRQDKWTDHFHLRGARIVADTDEAAATIQLLQLNHPD